MPGVINKFVLTSISMLVAPIAILYGFNQNLFPGSSRLSPESMTLWSGLVAVISVNMVIAFYIYMAIKEPSDNKHVPDPNFLADAKASIKKNAEPSAAAASSARRRARRDN